MAPEHEGNKQSGSTESGQIPGYEEMNKRVEALLGFASRMRVDCKNDLERVGDDPIAKIGIIAKALGVDAVTALNPAVDVNQLLGPKSAPKR